MLTMFNEYSDTPQWLENEQKDTLQSLLENLGDFVDNGMDDISETAKAILQSPLMLHNVMVARIMQVGLLQRQNDMIRQSQEVSDVDLLSTSVTTVNTNPNQITQSYSQAQTLKGFTISSDTTTTVTLYQHGLKTLGQYKVIFQSVIQTGIPIPISELEQLITQGNALYIATNDNAIIEFSADIRPVIRYKDSIYRSQRNTI